ncbi:MAG: TlpA family protein disulfide reductase [Bryobacteraceae bacterium]|nr:TlpA family protein disulfide reductase [Bryobacteraceae bacterium]
MTRFLSVLLAAAFVWAQSGRPSLVREVRTAATRGDLAGGERLIAEYRSDHGVTPEMLEALSWLGRGALGAEKLDEADRYAAETRELALEMLKGRELDAERRLPIALGASIEVQAQVLARKGARAEAIALLNEELARWRQTSMRARIQKNIHLLSLEGKPAPPLETSEHLGPRPRPLSELKGRTVLLFFWAHWCGDCKAQAPALAKLQAEFGKRGLTIVAPTQRYGYAARGEDAAPAQELQYIDGVRIQHYSAIGDMPVPVSEENFKNYGSSTTPTLVLIDRAGIVRLYHPGQMPYEALAAKVAALTGS